MNQFMQSIAYTKKLACYNKKMSLFHALLVQIQFKYSSLEKKKLSNGFKKSPKFNITQFLISYDCKKKLQVKLQLEHHSDSKSQRILLSSLKLLRRWLVS